jgi:hypothetical protein
MPPEHEQHGRVRIQGTRGSWVWGWVMSSIGLRVLGLFVVSVLLAAENAKSETYGETVGAVVLALFLYWVTVSYTRFTASRIEHGEPLTARGLAQEMWHDLSLLTGAALPLLVVVICWAAGVSLALGIRLALWLDAALIVLIEIIAGLGAPLKRYELVIQTLFGAALGLGVLALRLVLH